MTKPGDLPTKKTIQELSKEFSINESDYYGIDETDDDDETEDNNVL